MPVQPRRPNRLTAPDLPRSEPAVAGSPIETRPKVRFSGSSGREGEPAIDRASS